MSDETTRWIISHEPVPYGPERWMLRRDMKVVGSVTFVGSEFRAFLRSSESGEGKYIGTFANVPLAVEAIKMMLEMSL